MFTRSLFLRSVGAAALVGVLSLSAFADTIRLKDGSIIKGKITGFTGGRFTVLDLRRSADVDGTGVGWTPVATPAQ